MRTSIDTAWNDRERGDKPVPGHEEWILYALATPYVARVDAQDLDGALQRKYVHLIWLTHEGVASVNVNGTELHEMDIDRLHEGTRAHVM